MDCDLCVLLGQQLGGGGGGGGGAAQQATHPCSKCTIRSGALHTRTRKTVDCDLCVLLGHAEKDGWVCYHTDMCTEDHCNIMQAQVDELEAELPHIREKLEKFRTESKITLQEDPTNDPSEKDLSDVTSIHFNIQSANRTKRTQYAKNLMEDFQLHGMEQSGTLQERQDRLKQRHISEWMYIHASSVIDMFGASSSNTALVLLLDAVPCLLHMENRMGLKILSMCLKTGLAHAKNDQIPWLKSPSDNKPLTIDQRCNQFIQGINYRMQTNVLGSRGFPCYWEVPYDKTKQISPLTMDNVRMRKVMARFKEMIALCVQVPSDKAKWTEAVQHYRVSAEIVNRKHSLSEKECHEYQKHADEFFQLWVELHGEHGITNYAHLIGSGHILEYLLEWKNLSCHSQQGWEGKWMVDSRISFHVQLIDSFLAAFNSLFKKFYFNRTQRGGSVKRGRGRKTRLEPIARWLQRRMIFMRDITVETMQRELGNRSANDTTFTNWVRDCGGTMEYGKRMCMDSVGVQYIVDDDDKWEFTDETSTMESLHPNDWFHGLEWVDNDDDHDFDPDTIEL